MDKKSIDYALSNFDINKILDGKCHIIEYSDLYNLNNIYDVLGVYKCCVILYRSSNINAHWCCIFENKDGNIEFFDPYGIIIDNEIDKNYIDNRFYNDYYHRGYHKLSELIINSNYKHIEYNNIKMQEMKSNINTCGRHVSTRLLFRDFSLEEYVNLLGGKNIKYFDNKVLDITNKYI